jgi:hypothetical protein
VLVLVGQIKNHESLSRDVEHMNPNEVVEHPTFRAVLGSFRQIRKPEIAPVEDK